MSFLRRTRAKTLTSVGQVVVSKLCEAYSKLSSACGPAEESWDMQSPEGAAACTEFLQEVDAASTAMRVEMAARDYRENFTVNYQVLFPGDDRHYRLDILTACTEQYSGIWLNGERYDFSAEVTKKAEALMHAFTELLKTLGSLEPKKKEQDEGELKKALRMFDEAWAQFEHNYILGLMHIEDQAKKLVRDAIQQEYKLQELEYAAAECNNAEILIDVEICKFVACISQLNVVANSERKGRGDLTADILWQAKKFWQGPEAGVSRSSNEHGSRCLKNADENHESAEPSFGKVKSKDSTASTTSSLGGVATKVFGILKSASNSCKSAHNSTRVVKFFPDENDSDDDDNDDDACVDGTSNASTASTEEYLNPAVSDKHQKQELESMGDRCAAQCLAGDVVESYWHVRYYLRDISNSLERIDPNLSSNTELVSRLVDWEESWEVGRDYVRDASMLQIVGELVSFLKEVEKLEPAFADMTQECDAEFCLCLPRLVWLHFLQDPERHVRLLQQFLPHHFADNKEAHQSPWDESIQDLLNCYGKAEREVTQLSKRVADQGCSVHRFLVQSVIAGPNSETQPDFSLEMQLNSVSDSSALVNSLVHAIEERSMELQRFRPEAWNHFMMVIVRCFSQGAPKQRQRMGPKAPVPKMQPARRRSLWRNRPRLRTMTNACLSGVSS